MRVTRYTNPREFYDLALPLLMEGEAENCFFLGHVPTLTNPTDVLLCIVWDGDRAVAAAIKTPDRPMLTTAMPPGTIEPLVDFLMGEKIELTGIQSRSADAENLAELWCARTGVLRQDTRGMGIFRLTRVIPPRKVPGELREATLDDRPLLEAWVDDFGLEIGDREPLDRAKFIPDRVAQKRLFIWQNAEPVSMASWAGPTPNGVRINLVYTPPQFRARGYASACVATLTQRMLDSGKKFCFLYTDLSNPTSNKIYRDIGYQHVRDDTRIFFAAPT